MSKSKGNVYTERWGCRQFCMATTGHDQTWPYDVNPACPVCERDFMLSDELIIAWEGDEGDEEIVAYHAQCYESNP